MQFALQYLRAGYSVIPLKPRSKEPLIPWQEYQKRRATEAEVRGWFAKTPAANLGIVTGFISGLGVVDVDGPEGQQSFAGLQLSSPTIVLTGKGKQFYFKHPGGNLCNAVRKYPGIDIRGDGGYVVAPPSIHPNGKRYQWSGAGNVALNSHLPIFPMALFTATNALSGCLPTGTKSAGWVAEALKEMTNGNIDDTLFKVCARLRADGYTQADATAFLSPHADRAGATPGHLADKIANVWKRYSPNPKQTEQSAESIASFMEALTPVEWICAPIIAKGSLGFVAGLPETDKTWILIDLALECALPRGLMRKWLGLFPVDHARVLFIDQERFKGETQRRFKAVMAEKGIAAADLKDNLFIRCGTTTRLDLEPSYQAFHRELLEIKPDLVIIDSWAAFQTCDENSRQGVQVVLERIKALRTEIGCTFLFIDHESKAVFWDQENNELPSAMRMVGSVGKVAAAEMVLTVRRFDSDTVIVHHTKSSLASAAKSFVVKVVDTERGIRVYGEGEKC